MGIHPKWPTAWACDRYCLAMETKGSKHEGSAVDEVDMVVRVLGCRDEEIEQGQQISPSKPNIERPSSISVGGKNGLRWR